MGACRWCNPTTGATSFSFFFFFLVFLVECDESICSVQHLDMTKAIVLLYNVSVEFKLLLAHVGLGRPSGHLGGHNHEYGVTEDTTSGLEVINTLGQLSWTLVELETSRREPQI